LKPLLLDQSIIAGLGNIYVDESLWMARLHPTRLGDSLSDKEIKALYQAIPQVLRQGLKNQGTSLGNGKGNFLPPAATRPKSGSFAGFSSDRSALFGLRYENRKDDRRAAQHPFLPALPTAQIVI
jgi:hypothetical protein